MSMKPKFGTSEASRYRAPTRPTSASSSDTDAVVGSCAMLTAGRSRRRSAAAYSGDVAQTITPSASFRRNASARWFAVAYSRENRHGPCWAAKEEIPSKIARVYVPTRSSISGTCLCARFTGDVTASSLRRNALRENRTNLRVHAWQRHDRLTIGASCGKDCSHRPGKLGEDGAQRDGNGFHCRRRQSPWGRLLARPPTGGLPHVAAVRRRHR